MSNLPPHQQLAAPGKWPVVGERQPRASTEAWTLTVSGLIDNPSSWTLAELQEFPQVERTIDIHCVTRWSKPGAVFKGVLLETVLSECGVSPDARFLSFVARSERNHSTSLSLQTAVELGTLLAFEFEGAPLETIHGGPLRTVVPARYFYKSLKWLERIEVLSEDRLGYWEAETGYHNNADPWREERFLAANLDRRLVQQLLESRDFSERDLRGIDAAERELTGLNARGSAIRNGNFRRANLSNACFDGANLSNAHFQEANLTGASFQPWNGTSPDLEGVNFCGADLRGAIFHQASLFGCTFFPVDAHEQPALIDATTSIDETTLVTLEATPQQANFLREQIGEILDESSSAIDENHSDE